jgi:hypothetical protein
MGFRVSSCHRNLQANFSGALEPQIREKWLVFSTVQGSLGKVGKEKQGQERIESSTCLAL